MEILLYISTEKKDLYDPSFCISVLIVYIFIKRTDVGHCFFPKISIIPNNIMFVFFLFI